MAQQGTFTAVVVHTPYIESNHFTTRLHFCYLPILLNYKKYMNTEYHIMYMGANNCMTKMLFPWD